MHVIAVWQCSISAGGAPVSAAAAETVQAVASATSLSLRCVHRASRQVLAQTAIARRLADDTAAAGCIRCRRRDDWEAVLYSVGHVQQPVVSVAMLSFAEQGWSSSVSVGGVARRCSSWMFVITSTVVSCLSAPPLDLDLLYDGISHPFFATFCFLYIYIYIYAYKAFCVFVCSLKIRERVG